MVDEKRQELLKAIRDDGRFPMEAYVFLHEGLDFTTRRLFPSRNPDEPRHVSGQELCEGLRDAALQRWGPLAQTVLNHWNIYRTRDFGEMVYFLIEIGAMNRQESDSITDFDNVYDFDEAFGEYEIELDGPEE